MIFIAQFSKSNINYIFIWGINPPPPPTPPPPPKQNHQTKTKKNNNLKEKPNQKKHKKEDYNVNFFVWGVGVFLVL